MMPRIYFKWVEYGYLIPSWTNPTLTLFYTLLILAIKNAQENEIKTITHIKEKSYLELFIMEQ
jgi:hypothetical protein